MMRRFDEKRKDVTAVLVAIATLFASLLWISSGQAATDTSDLRTAALGIMMLRLEAGTEASNALVQAQMYYAEYEEALDRAATADASADL